MAAISEYEKDPASDSNPAASHTSNTVLALPTLQVITRVLRKTPVPIMFATFTAIAPQAPTPRVNSPLAAVVEAASLIGVVVSGKRTLIFRKSPAGPRRTAALLHLPPLSPQLWSAAAASRAHARTLLSYRLILSFGDMPAAHPPGAEPASRTLAPASTLQSPLTFGLFFVLMGYYEASRMTRPSGGGLRKQSRQL